MAKANEKTQKGLVGIGAAIKGLKSQQKAMGPKKLSPEARRKVAQGRFIGALERRGWRSDGPGRFKLGEHQVRTTPEDHVVVDDRYRLDLGAGAIGELDQYVKLATEVR